MLVLLLLISVNFFPSYSLNIFQSIIRVKPRVSMMGNVAASNNVPLGAISVLAQPSIAQRVKGSLIGFYVGDALAMPVHWYYDLNQLYRDFGRNGITKYEAPKVSCFYLLLSIVKALIFNVLCLT